MNPLIPILIIASIFVFNYLKRQNQNEKRQEEKDKYTELLKKVKERENLKEFDEPRFWELINKIIDTAGNNYNNKIGVFKSLLNEMSPEEMIELDNLVNRLISSNLNHKIIATAQIMFKTSEFGAVTLLMTYFILKGNNFFQYACQNPELITEEDIVDLSYETIKDVIEYKYRIKTKELLPITNLKIDISGTPLTIKDYPVVLPKIWQKFG